MSASSGEAVSSARRRGVVDRRWRPSSPGSGSTGSRSTARRTTRRGRARRSSKRAAAHAVRPLPRRERRRDAHAADPARLPDVLAADRSRSRRRPDPERASGDRAAAARRLPAARRWSTTPAWWRVIETGVPSGRWTRRPSIPARPGLGIGARGRRAGDAPPGALVVRRSAASTRRCSATRCPGTRPGPSDARRVVLFAVGVAGVPEIHIDEALCCAELIARGE